MIQRVSVAAGKLRHLGGWKKEPGDHRDLKLLVPGPILPPSANLEPMMPPVNDQGQLGTCVANGSSEAFEAIEPADVSPKRVYSRLYIYFYGRQMEGIPPSEDSGMYVRDAMKVLAARGVCLEPTWPYSDDATTFTQQPPPACDVEAAQHKALFYYRCADAGGNANVHAMKSSMAQGFPVVFGFNVPQNFMSTACATTGILHFPAANESYVGGHCVVAIGYDDNMVIDGVPGAFLCRNSWGEGWGLKGNFWMPYRFVQDGIADDPWTIRRAQS